ncbi:predicted protein [Uncinocarpus reesii 1704]|uniref:N-acetyltransferase domain-containing protein n=1 Tax=Uncinocarpus reesii (strain UAMH 1704) TaxID=336963 RepID=C4JSF5_UNCRE|nr:uncharacterized protein UREG_05394 [Uncinocarpus reesii 1704]EEP80552.1 predicted protein [Uncinocarpus reesii 1704]
MEFPRSQAEPSGPVITYREAREDEKDAIDALDDSYTTTSIYKVDISPDGFGFSIRRETIETPITRNYSDEESDSDSDSDSNYSPRKKESESSPSNAYTIVATINEDQICGVIDLIYRAWNRRLVITDIIVAPERRGNGIGKKLMSMALDWGREVHGAKHAWLEVSNLNSPAIESYQGMGFTFCGLDLTLQRGQNEVHQVLYS